MHHALHIGEILFNVFGHCYYTNPSQAVERSRSTADLAALARTCRTFKEPALDVLWSELIDLSPLAFCLPECHRSSGNVLLFFILMHFSHAFVSQCYSFSRPRNDAEWDTLRSYTRRVWCIVSFSSPKGYLDPTCISTTFNPPLVDPLFPNLRFLKWQGGIATLPVMHFSVPLLTSLDIRSAPREDVSVYTHLLNTLVPRCSNIRKVRIQVTANVQFGETVYCHLRTWNKLQVIHCHDFPMPVDVIPHVSHISTLLWLSFSLHTPSPTLISPPTSPLTFSQLAFLEMASESLDSVTSLIAQIRLPAVRVLIATFTTRPARATVTSYLSTLNTTCTSNSLTDLRLLNLRTSIAHISPPIDDTPQDDRLTLDDLRPCMAFRNLRALHINLEWSIDLTDADLLALVSAWPNIQHLVINDRWGWRTTHGITLNGLVQILQRCRFLWELCIALDTENVTDTSGPLDVDVSSRNPFRLNVADSLIRPEPASALRTLLSVFEFSHNSDRFLAWAGSEMEGMPGADTFRHLWRSVFL